METYAMTRRLFLLAAAAAPVAEKLNSLPPLCVNVGADLTGFYKAFSRYRAAAMFDVPVEMLGGAPHGESRQSIDEVRKVILESWAETAERNFK